MKNCLKQRIRTKKYEPKVTVIEYDSSEEYNRINSCLDSFYEHFCLRGGGDTTALKVIARISNHHPGAIDIFPGVEHSIVGIGRHPDSKGLNGIISCDFETGELFVRILPLMESIIIHRNLERAEGERGE